MDCSVYYCLLSNNSNTCFKTKCRGLYVDIASANVTNYKIIWPPKKYISLKLYITRRFEDS